MKFNISEISIQGTLLCGVQYGLFDAFVQSDLSMPTLVTIDQSNVIERPPDAPCLNSKS
jgi:hypothetical protein